MDENEIEKYPCGAPVTERAGLCGLECENGKCPIADKVGIGDHHPPGAWCNHIRCGCKAQITQIDAGDGMDKEIKEVIDHVLVNVEYCNLAPSVEYQDKDYTARNSLDLVRQICSENEIDCTNLTHEAYLHQLGVGIQETKSMIERHKKEMSDLEEWIGELRVRLYRFESLYKLAREEYKLEEST